MTQSAVRPSRRRLVIAGAATAAVAAAVVVPAATSSAASLKLPPRTAAELLASVEATGAASNALGLSGTVVQTSRLGLPALPSGAARTDALALLSGSHTLQVHAAGPDRQRIALLGQLAEYDVVRNGRDVWTYTSDSRTATHLQLPAASSTHASGAAGDPAGQYQSPQQAAAAALDAINPTTAVGIEANVRVARRAAYQLVLTPRDTATLIRSVRIAIDAATSLPLRVQVWGSSSSTQPAVEVGFTDISFTTSPASVFAFAPPVGTKVVEQQAPSTQKSTDPAASSQTQTQTRTLGTGWTSVVAARGAGVGALDPGRRSLLDRLTRPVPGGRVLTSSLVSVLLSDDGRLSAGAVPAGTLSKVAAGDR